MVLVALFILAFLVFLLIHNNFNVIKKDELQLQFKDGKNYIELKKEARKSDEQGIKENTYEFELKNTSNHEKDYSILIEDVEDDRNSIDSSYLKYSVSIDGVQGDIYSIKDGVDEIVIDSGNLERNQVKEYVLSIWIDEEAPKKVEQGQFQSRLDIETERTEINNYQKIDFVVNEDILGTWHLNNHVISDDNSSLMDLFGTSLSQVGNQLVFKKDGTYEMGCGLAFNEEGKYKMDDNGNIELYDIQSVDGAIEHENKILEYTEFQGVKFLKFDITDYHDGTYIYFEKADKNIGSSEIPNIDLDNDDSSNNTTSEKIVVGNYMLSLGTYTLDNPEYYVGYNEQLILKEDGKCVYTSSTRYGSSELGTVDCTYEVLDHDWAQDSSSSMVEPSLKISYYAAGYNSNVDFWFFVNENNRLGQEMYSLSLK